MPRGWCQAAEAVSDGTMQTPRGRCQFPGKHRCGPCKQTPDIIALAICGNFCGGSPCMAAAVHAARCMPDAARACCAEQNAMAAMWLAGRLAGGICPSARPAPLQAIGLFGQSVRSGRIVAKLPTILGRPWRLAPVRRALRHVSGCCRSACCMPDICRRMPPAVAHIPILIG